MDVILLVRSTFETSILLETLLKYRLAICRDYAKLTAVLLYNLFPNNPIYFILIPRHVAAGIEINGKLYILDQKLSVMTLDGWLRIWNRKIATVYRLKILDSKSKRKLKLEKRGIAKLKDQSTRINVERLTEEVVKLIGVKQVDYGEGAVAKIPLPSKLTKCYEDDEIVTYSMARTIKLKLENEFCSNFKNIEKIGIRQDGEDLVVEVCFK